jgi:hypothetical protein
MHIVAVPSPKGGVGKSTIISQLMKQFSDEGVVHAVIDTDIQNSLFERLAYSQIFVRPEDVPEHLDEDTCYDLLNSTQEVTEWQLEADNIADVVNMWTKSAEQGLWYRVVSKALDEDSVKTGLGFFKDSYIASVPSEIMRDGFTKGKILTTLAKFNPEVLLFDFRPPTFDDLCDTLMLAEDVAKDYTIILPTRPHKDEVAESAARLRLIRNELIGRGVQENKIKTAIVINKDAPYCSPERLNSSFNKVREWLLDYSTDPFERTFRKSIKDELGWALLNSQIGIQEENWITNNIVSLYKEKKAFVNNEIEAILNHEGTDAELLDRYSRFVHFINWDSCFFYSDISNDERNYAGYAYSGRERALEISAYYKESFEKKLSKNRFRDGINPQLDCYVYDILQNPYKMVFDVEQYIPNLRKPIKIEKYCPNSSQRHGWEFEPEKYVNHEQAYKIVQEFLDETQIYHLPEVMLVEELWKDVNNLWEKLENLENELYNLGRPQTTVKESYIDMGMHDHGYRGYDIFLEYQKMIDLDIWEASAPYEFKQTFTEIIGMILDK